MLRWLTRAAEQEREREAQVYAHAVYLLTQAREELNKADAKAQVLLGVVGLGVGAVVGGLLAGSWSPFRLSPWIQWAWWLGAASAVAALVCLAGAVYPRTGPDKASDGRGISYFADVRRYHSAQAVADVLRRSPNHDLLRLAGQIKQISRIVTRKYQLIRWGFWLLLAAILLSITAVLVNLPL